MQASVEERQDMQPPMLRTHLAGESTGCLVYAWEEHAGSAFVGARILFLGGLAPFAV